MKSQIFSIQPKLNAITTIEKSKVNFTKYTSYIDLSYSGPYFLENGCDKYFNFIWRKPTPR